MCSNSLYKLAHPQPHRTLPFTLTQTRSHHLPIRITFLTRLKHVHIRASARSGPVTYSPPDPSASLYKVLGVSEDVTLGEIKKAFKKMVRRYHPDVSPPGLVEENTKLFIRVQKAYETLSDPKSRDLYDTDLAGGSHLDDKNFVDKDSASRRRNKVGVDSVCQEKAYLVGVVKKGKEDSFGFEESLKELAQLADTAGLTVVGSTYQKVNTPNSRTYIGSGKVAEIKIAVHAFRAETVIFDDELSAGQLWNLEQAFDGDVRVCDRTALILDIFNQRAATHEAFLQVALARMEYQLPRLTKMWTHLERQSGGQMRGMGEKQIEMDKRILRIQIVALKKELETVGKHRKQYRTRRVSFPVPVVSLVGYTNAGKSTLLNQLTGANVLAEDFLFATLDPTTRRVQMKNCKEFLVTDTVGFIQKLPTTLVAAFRATLEEISESSLMVHVVDICHPLAEQQIEAVDKVLSELDVESIPKLMVWNKVDRANDPAKLKVEAKKREDTICISALTGEGLDEFCNAVKEKLKDSMVWIEALIPFDEGELLSSMHRVGMVENSEYTENGTLMKGYVPPRFARLLTPFRHLTIAAIRAPLELQESP